jgi:hypothetical protein
VRQMLMTIILEGGRESGSVRTTARSREYRRE